MSEYNPNWIKFDGTPVGGQVPTPVFSSGPMTEAQAVAVSHVYGAFCQDKLLSLAHTHRQEYRLADGTEIEITSIFGVDTITVAPAAGAPSTQELWGIGATIRSASGATIPGFPSRFILQPELVKNSNPPRGTGKWRMLTPDTWESGYRPWSNADGSNWAVTAGGMIYRAGRQIALRDTGEGSTVFRVGGAGPLAFVAAGAGSSSALYVAQVSAGSTSFAQVASVGHPSGWAMNYPALSVHPSGARLRGLGAVPGYPLQEVEFAVSQTGLTVTAADLPYTDSIDLTSTANYTEVSSEPEIRAPVTQEYDQWVLNDGGNLEYVGKATYKAGYSVTQPAPSHLSATGRRSRVESQRRAAETYFTRDGAAQTDWGEYESRSLGSLDLQQSDMNDTATQTCNMTFSRHTTSRRTYSGETMVVSDHRVAMVEDLRVVDFSSSSVSYTIDMTSSLCTVLLWEPNRQILVYVEGTTSTRIEGTRAHPVTQAELAVELDTPVITESVPMLTIKVAGSVVYTAPVVEATYTPNSISRTSAGAPLYLHQVRSITDNWPRWAQTQPQPMVKTVPVFGLEQLAYSLPDGSPPGTFYPRVEPSGPVNATYSGFAPGHDRTVFTNDVNDQSPPRPGVPRDAMAALDPILNYPFNPAALNVPLAAYCAADPKTGAVLLHIRTDQYHSEPARSWIADDVGFRPLSQVLSGSGLAALPGADIQIPELKTV